MTAGEQRIDIFGYLPARRWHWYVLYACWLVYLWPLINLLHQAIVILDVRIKLGHWPSNGLDAYTYYDSIWGRFPVADNFFLPCLVSPVFVLPLSLIILNMFLLGASHRKVFRWHVYGTVIYWISVILLWLHLRMDPFCYFYWYFD